MIRIMRTREEVGRTGVIADPSLFMRARWPLGDLLAVFSRTAQLPCVSGRCEEELMRDGSRTVGGRSNGMANRSDVAA